MNIKGKNKLGFSQIYPKKIGWRHDQVLLYGIVIVEVDKHHFAEPD